MAARRKKARKAARRAKPRARSRARPTQKRSAPKRVKPARPARPKRPAAKHAARPARPEPVRRPAADRRLVAGAAQEVGVVRHYYPRAGAAVVALTGPLRRGDSIHVRGHTTDFVQPVTELALDGSAADAAAPPAEVGVRLAQRARAGDRVFRVSW